MSRTLLATGGKTVVTILRGSILSLIALALLLARSAAQAPQRPAVGVIPPYDRRARPGEVNPETGRYDFSSIPSDSRAYFGFSVPPAKGYAPRPPGGNRAQLRMIVPANAVIWVEDTRTTLTGTTRTFVSPPLTPGRSYVYTIRVRGTSGGNTIDEERKVRVRANAWRTIDFTRSVAQ
jgi:uncharacterized protein (TIGR03000 family)